MLGEMNFQRRKDYSSPNNSSNNILSNINTINSIEQNKTLYDFVLKLDTKIRNLENNITLIQSQYINIINKINLNNQNLLEKNNNNNNEDNLTMYDKNQIQNLVLKIFPI
jgi:hypothetical protein